MEGGRHAKLDQLLLVPPELAADRHRIVGDARHVAAGVRVARFDRVGQHLDGVQIGALQVARHAVEGAAERPELPGAYGGPARTLRSPPLSARVAATSRRTGRAMRRSPSSQAASSASAAAAPSSSKLRVSCAFAAASATPSGKPMMTWTSAARVVTTAVAKPSR